MDLVAKSFASAKARAQFMILSYSSKVEYTCSRVFYLLEIKGFKAFAAFINVA